MSPKGSKTVEASTEETHAAREVARVPAEETSETRSNRDSLALTSTRERSLANAVEDLQNEASESQPGL